MCIGTKYKPVIGKFSGHRPEFVHLIGEHDDVYPLDFLDDLDDLEALIS